MANLDNNYEADYMDAMADRLADIEEAMKESNQSEWSLTEIDGQFVGFSVTNTSEDWDGIDEISSAERNACDHYNERYVIND